MTRPRTPLHVVWFKRDLRCHDHRPLATAAALGPVLPLFVVEPDLWRAPDMSARQWAFVTESLHDLRAALADLGQPLVVRVGGVIATLEAIAARHGIAALWSHQETGNGWTYARDRAVAAWCAERGIAWQEARQDGVMRRLASRSGWARRFDREMAEPPLPAPALAPLAGIDPGAIPQADDLGLAPDACPGRQTGGRRAARTCLDSFLTERGKPYRRAMSSPVTAARACSRLSPHLAWGTLSLREALHATRARRAALSEADGAWRGALSSFEARLHWRGHFMQKLEDAPSIEHRNLHRAYDGLRPAESDAIRLAAWCNGETGLPFVDACMRALAATGWLPFRARAMLMAVASYHLWLHWKTPGAHLARLFVDYEPGIHWPQVQMQSGTTGINTIRIYNPVKQGLDQDPAGSFTRTWVPELAGVPDAFLHEPWKWPHAESLLGTRYPRPVVDHLAAARAARERIWAVRDGTAFRVQADRIQNRHGSRKSGLKQRGQRASRPATGTAQLSLDFGPPDDTPGSRA